jgi:hypothetical protein
VVLAEVADADDTDAQGPVGTRRGGAAHLAASGWRSRPLEALSFRFRQNETR